jgi:hypothetical protein
VRFSGATAREIAHCPFCAQPLELLSAAAALGLRLLAVERLDGGCERTVAHLAAQLPGPRPPAPPL